MNLWILIPFFFLVAIAQTVWMPLFSIAGIRVDLALVLVVAWGLQNPVGEAAIGGFIAGVFLDLISGLPLGTQTIALTAVGWLMGLVPLNVFQENVLLPPAAMIIATLVYNLFVLGILAALNTSISWSDYLLRVTLPSAILNTIAFPFIYLPLQWSTRRRPPLT